MKRKYRLRNYRLRKLTIVSMIALALGRGLIPDACAAVSSQMDVMWNTTAARAYGNDMGYGVYGGNFSLRAPTGTFSIVSFDPPHFDAGCSGIDMFLGSFSFMNGQQFSAMVRMIIQNAAGYLVHLAIAAICNPCEAIMSKLEKIMQELNAGQMNTCRISKMMVSTAIKAPGIDGLMQMLGTAKDEVNQNALTEVGGSNDFFSSILQNFTSGNTATNVAQAQTSTDYGNVVVNAVMTKNALSTFSNTAIFGGNLGLTEVLISIFGTNVIATTASADSPAGAGQDQSLPAESYDPVLTFKDLVDGPGNNSKLMYNCTDWSDGDPSTCQHIKRNIEFASLNFPGTLRYVVQALAGDQGSSSVLASDVNADQLITVIQPDSLIFNIQNGVPPTADQAAFLHALPYNYGTLLMDAYQVSANITIYNRIAQLASEDLAGSLAQGLITILDTAYVPGSNQAATSGKITSPMPASVKEARATFYRALAQYQGDTMKDRLARMNELTAAIRAEMIAAPRLSPSNK